MYHRLGNEIPNTHIPSQEQSDLGRGDIVLDELLDDPDIVFPGLEGAEGFVYVCSGAL